MRKPRLPIAKDTTGGIARAKSPDAQSSVPSPPRQMTRSTLSESSSFLTTCARSGHTARISALISSRSGVRRRAIPVVSAAHVKSATFCGVSSEATSA